MTAPEEPPAAANQFIAIAPHYDRLMRDVPYEFWVRYLQQLLDRRGLVPHRVLDLACGTGSVLEILARKGFQVTGVDISEPMIAQAKRKAARRGLAIDYQVQDASSLSLNGPPYDLCVSLFDSLNYITDPSALQCAIHCVFAHLRPGGLFIFDINSEFALVNDLFAQQNMDTDEALRYVWRSSYDPETRLCTVTMRFFLRHTDGVDRELNETHLQFAYTEHQLRDMLCCAGFTNVETFHAYTTRPVSPTSDRIFFVATRPE